MRSQIHWFSIINSCVTVVLLTGFLATILMRVLKNDFIKYTRDDESASHLRQFSVVLSCNNQSNDIVRHCCVLLCKGLAASSKGPIEPPGLTSKMKSWLPGAVLEDMEESGWKNIHSEVFRFPPNKNLFCALVGSGYQVHYTFPAIS